MSVRFLGLLVLVLSCAHPAPKRTPPPDDSKQLEDVRWPCRQAAVMLAPLTTAFPAPTPSDSVTLRRAACFGMCPVYSVTLHGDGRVSAVGERYVTNVGPLAWSIPPALAQRVLLEFLRVDVFSREASMKHVVTDLPSANLEVAIGGRHVVIRHYGAGAELRMGLAGPDNELLTRLETLIDSATETPSRLLGCGGER